MSSLIDLIFPRTCSGCGRVGNYFCEKCKSIISYKGITTKNLGQAQGCLSLYRYRGPIKQSITDLKFKFVTDIVSELTELMVYTLINNYPHLLHYWQENKFVLIPIPLHSRRRAWRSFNQSELICQSLSAKLCLKYDSLCLVRNRNTIPQTSIKDKKTRRTNTESSFALSSINFPENVILFDDVYTTGSTVKSAISTFPENTNAWVLTIAG